MIQQVCTWCGQLQVGLGFDALTWIWSKKDTVYLIFNVWLCTLVLCYLETFCTWALCLLQILVWHGSCFVAWVMSHDSWSSHWPTHLLILRRFVWIRCVRQANAKGEVLRHLTMWPPCHFHFLRVLSVDSKPSLKSKRTSTDHVSYPSHLIDKERLSNSFRKMFASAGLFSLFLSVGRYQFPVAQ